MKKQLRLIVFLLGVAALFAALSLLLTADEGAQYTVQYVTSDPKIITGDGNGNLYAAKRGTAEITVRVKDGYGHEVTDSCTVKVKYSFPQWLIVIFLFGWIWY